MLMRATLPVLMRATLQMLMRATLHMLMRATLPMHVRVIVPVLMRIPHFPPFCRCRIPRAPCSIAVDDDFQAETVAEAPLARPIPSDRAYDRTLSPP
eukprot:6213678-Pleurochrysis_carterae.AAC.12